MGQQRTESTTRTMISMMHVNRYCEGETLEVNQADSWINAERGINRVPHPSQQGPMLWMTLLPQLEFSKYDGDPRRWSKFINVPDFVRTKRRPC